ncbi:MAG: cobyrinate a,c-diamide synthase [Desulfobulbaceae bacterium]|jgi:cobyrinic acid a,c-diamide synthase|nr:cobyrinate a,c-diamide synthase [Desulfobulbaceae bacterium]
MATNGILIAGLSGGSGKSLIAVGLVAALKERGMTIAPFKKGPDYIDAGWLKLAARLPPAAACASRLSNDVSQADANKNGQAGRPCYNLDPYLVPADRLLEHFRRRAAGADLAIIEGNRGLYDGVTADGGYASADLAMLLDLPVILVVDCTKMTRTVAALVLGCQQFEPRLDIAGVILNQIATNRQERLIRQTVERATGIAVLGATPRLSKDIFPMRHLGMLPWQEYDGHDQAIAELAHLAREHCDLDKIIAMARPVAPPSACLLRQAPAEVRRQGGILLRIGVFHDASFQFYYTENLEALQNLDAELIAINALTDSALPENLDGLYIGGGFPETSARQLADNSNFRQAVRQASADSLPIYAECGGLIYLCQSIEVDGAVFPMAGIFPARLKMEEKPQAHGYCHFEVDGDNPFYQRGAAIRGHEFRYSRVIGWPNEPTLLALRMTRGQGFADGRDGLLFRNTLALYTHVHADGAPEWAEGFIACCRRRRKEKMEQRMDETAPLSTWPDSV